MTIPSTNISLCILAHNEERHIQQCIRAGIYGLPSGFMNLFVYANGCTDHTAERVKELAQKNQNIYLRSLVIASKPLAWNAAFNEQQSDYIIFSDGDVIPEPNAAQTLVAGLKSNPDAVVATSRQMPKKHELNLQQKMVGFLQLPLQHEFLSGGFYAVRRQALADIMFNNGFNGIPAGITGEDCFLEYLLNPGQLIICDCITYYEPPVFKDYLRYLARIRWQNEQLRAVYGVQLADTRGSVRKFFHKVHSCKDKRYLLLSIPAVILRIIFKKIFSKQIDHIYQSLGPVVRDGSGILSNLTRSNSTK